MPPELAPKRLLRTLLAIFVPWQIRLYARGTPAERRRDKVVTTALGLTAAGMSGAAGGLEPGLFVLAGVAIGLGSMLAADRMVARGARRRRELRAAQRASASERITAS